MKKHHIRKVFTKGWRWLNKKNHSFLDFCAVMTMAAQLGYIVDLVEVGKVGMLAAIHLLIFCLLLGWYIDNYRN